MSKQSEMEQGGKRRSERKRQVRAIECTRKEENENRARVRKRRKKNRSKQVLDPSTEPRACGAVTWDEKQRETGMEAVHRQARGRDLPAHFTWTSVRPDSYRVTVRERKRDSETDTYGQARPQDRKAGKESEGVTGHANNYPRESTIICCSATP